MFYFIFDICKQHVILINEREIAFAFSSPRTVISGIHPQSFMLGAGPSDVGIFMQLRTLDLDSTDCEFDNQRTSFSDGQNMWSQTYKKKITTLRNWVYTSGKELQLNGRSSIWYILDPQINSNLVLFVEFGLTDWPMDDDSTTFCKLLETNLSTFSSSLHVSFWA